MDKSSITITMSHLMKIPREVREAILELCLVIEGEINPYPTLYQDQDPFSDNNRKPDIVLLTFHKVINTEASKIFNGKNVWLLTWRLAGQFLPGNGG